MPRLSQHGGFDPELLAKVKEELSGNLEFSEQQEPLDRNKAGMPSISGFIEQHFNLGEHPAPFDFATCQRPDGSKYGSNGRCIKGSETSPASKDGKKGSSKSGGGATLDSASRKEYGSQAKKEKKAAKDIQDEMKRNGKTPALEKKLKQTEARAAKFERMSKTGVFESPKKK